MTVGPAADAVPATGEEPGWLFDAAFGGATNLGSTGIAPVATLGGWWRASARLALGLTALVPLGAERLTSAAESADVYPFELAAGVRARVGPQRRSWLAELEAGGGFLGFELQGTEVTGMDVTRARNVIVGGVHAELRAAWRVSPRLWLSPSLRAAAAIAKPVVFFANHEVGVVGRPLLVFAVGVEYQSQFEGHP